MGYQIFTDATAVVGTVLNIKPLLHVDEEGKLRVVEKPRGNKQALRAKLSRMKEDWNPEQGNLVIVGHGDCPRTGRGVQAKDFRTAS